MKAHITIIAILILSAMVRLWHLSLLPLYWEEAALGYDAYSILKTGKDYHNNNLPIVAFPSFGDYKPSLYFYATVPFIWLLGPTDIAVRLPSAVSGIVAVYLVYTLANLLGFSRRIAYLSGILLAISPWHIQFSRGAFEVNFGTTLFLLGLCLWLKSVKKEKIIYFAMICFAASMYAYHGFRLLTPLSILTLIIWTQKKIAPRSQMIGLFLFGILILPILIAIRDPQVSKRFAETSFLSQSTAVVITNQLRANHQNSLLSRVVYHRYWYWAGEMIGRYLSHFDINFLFLFGDVNPRHSTGEFAHLYHWEALALAIAIYRAVKKKDRRFLFLGIVLILIPIPAALTLATPHALRTLPMAPIFAIISAYGLADFFSKKSTVIAAGIVIAVESLIFFHFYFTHYPINSAPYWQYGYKEVVQFTESVKSNYRTIYFTRSYGRPSIYVLWYGRYDPKVVQMQNETTPKDQQELLAVANYKFTETIPPDEKEVLIVTTPDQPLMGHVIKTIFFPNNTPAFVIYEQ